MEQLLPSLLARQWRLERRVELSWPQSDAEEDTLRFYERCQELAEVEADIELLDEYQNPNLVR